MNLIGPNWKTSVSAAGAAIMSALTFLSTISYDQGPIALVIPVKFKPYVATIAGISALVLWIYNGIQQKSKNVTGGNTQQTVGGNYADPGQQTLVDATVKASIASGEKVTPEQQAAVNKPEGDK